MDALIHLINGLQLKARLTYAGGLCGRWAVDHNSQTAIWFHLATKGDGWVHSPAWAAPLAVTAGDLVVFMPHARKHFLSYSPTEVLLDAPDAAQVPLDDGAAGFVCGLIELRQPQAQIWRGLPAELVIRRQQAGDALARLLELVVDEAPATRYAGPVFIEHLLDAIFVLVIRHCVEQGLLAPSLMATLGDSRLAAALAALHREPARAWTLHSLCTEAGLSRTVLNEKFVRLVGCPPMEYLAAWRMQLAGTWLREAGMTVERVAERCGYDSVSAFSRAFKRHYAATPGRYRRPS